MTYVADLHLHSPYAMGTSPALSLESLAHWARVKGIDLLATADFTHPAWLSELEANLRPLANGLFALRGPPRWEGAPYFMLGTEVSCIYQQEGRTRRLHLLVFAPDFEAVRRLCRALGAHGSLESDGRPALDLSGRDLVELALQCDARCEVVVAHAWTPWYGVYGSKGGFDSLAECFDDMLPYIHAVETGLSSDPAMNWSVPELDGMCIVSFSDAHSAPRLGRELTVFHGAPSYEGFRQALRDQAIAYTVEFHPEEGKYHYDGHRRCGVSQHPSVSLEGGGRCPECGRKLTLGVLNRIETLSPTRVTAVQGEDGLFHDPLGRRSPFRRLIPLEEIIAEALGLRASAKGVQAVCSALVKACGSEMSALESAPVETLAAAAGERVAEGVVLARRGKVAITPGYDGVYGKVRVWDDRPFI